MWREYRIYFFMKKSFVSILSTDSYLPGIIVLYFSLKETKTKFPFLCLTTPNISLDTLITLSSYDIKYKRLGFNILNPTDIDRKHRWSNTYSKLHIFNQTEFSKIVYLDADMLVLKNIDELFKKPHMSAVSAGSMLIRRSHWTHLNSGLIVIKPYRNLFINMLSKIGKIENIKASHNEYKSTGGDQDFLNEYYKNWPKESRLHLDHKYNIFHHYLHEYNKDIGYSLSKGKKLVKILHFASHLKPWEITKKNLHNEKRTAIEIKVINLWKNIYKKIKNTYNPTLNYSELRNSKTNPKLYKIQSEGVVSAL